MKRCPFCAEEIQDAAVKCRFCNSMLVPTPGGSPGDALPVHAASGVPVVAGQSAPLVPLFEGSPSWKARFSAYLGAATLAILGVVVALLPTAVSTFEWTYALGLGGAILLVAAICWGYLSVATRTLKYRISTRTIDVESGVLSRKIETLQLWKVRDIQMQQTLFDRMLGIARIRVSTHDESTPHMDIIGLPESRRMFEKLKDSIEIARQSRNVVGIVE